MKVLMVSTPDNKERLQKWIVRNIGDEPDITLVTTSAQFLDCIADEEYEIIMLDYETPDEVMVGLKIAKFMASGVSKSFGKLRNVILNGTDTFGKRVIYEELFHGRVQYTTIEVYLGV